MYRIIIIIYPFITAILRLNCFLNHPRGADGRHGGFWDFACWKCLELAKRHKWYDFFCPWFRNYGGLSNHYFGSGKVRKKKEFGYWGRIFTIAE